MTDDQQEIVFLISRPSLPTFSFSLLSLRSFFFESLKVFQSDEHPYDNDCFIIQMTIDMDALGQGASVST